MYYTKSGTLSLPNDDGLTLQDLILQKANQEVELGLGVNKVLKLFGCADAAIWVGGNYPNGQKVTLRSGISGDKTPCDACK